MVRKTSGRVVRLVGGWLLLVIGVAALVLPGPGLLLVAAGLAVLSHEYPWAMRRLRPVRDKAFSVAAAGVQSVPAIVLSALVALTLVGVGILWGIRPESPSWWPLSPRWWLPGGWGTGTSLIGSGAIAAGLLVYSYRRFRQPGRSSGAAARDEGSAA